MAVAQPYTSLFKN